MHNWRFVISWMGWDGMDGWLEKQRFDSNDLIGFGLLMLQYKTFFVSTHRKRYLRKG